MPDRITVVAVDAFPHVLEAVRDQAPRWTDIELLATGSSGEDLVTLVGRHRPRVALVGMALWRKPDGSLSGDPHHDALMAIGCLRLAFRATQVIVVSFIGNAALLVGAIVAGARGYVMGHEVVDCLDEAIRRVADGGSWFSPRLLEALPPVDRWR